MMDNKLSELKRRADKCPIKRFKAFIGKANTQATLCADTGIEIIGWSGFDASDLNAKSHRVELARFIAAADPETILAILAELEAKDKELELEREKSRRVMSENHQQAERIAELEAQAKVWESAATKHLARAEEAEQRIAELSDLETHNECLIKKNSDLTQQNIKLGERLATPVRLPDTRQSVSGDRYQWSDGVFNYKQDAIALLREQGFIIEGGE